MSDANTVQPINCNIFSADFLSELYKKMSHSNNYNKTMMQAVLMSSGILVLTSRLICNQRNKQVSTKMFELEQNWASAFLR